MNRYTVLLVTAIPLLLLAACTDRKGPTEPEPPPTGSFELVLPEAVYEGQPFSLTVTAVAKDGTKPDAAFSGTVTLSASSGNITPASLTLSNGVGTADVTLSGFAGSLSLTARSGGASGSGPTTVVGNEAVARIVVAPGSFLLTGEGETRQLEARAFDAMGRPTRAEITWRSTDPREITVSAEGTVTAASGLGSAQIIAEADGVNSAPVLALVAQPVDGAVLVADSQVVGGSDRESTSISANVGWRVAGAQDGDLEPVDPEAQYGLGWQYRVTLTDIEAPQTGSILVGTGEAPIGGRVVSVSSSGEGHVVTLEVIRIDELFEQFVLEEVIALDDAEITLTEEVAAIYDTRRLPDGTLNFVPRSSGPLFSGSGMQRSGAVLLDFNLGPVKDFNLGPAKCKTSVTGVPVQLRAVPAVTIRPTLEVIDTFDVTTGLKRTGLRGEIRADIKFEPQFAARLEGKIDCKVEIAQITVPIGGVAALFFGLHVPLGAGLELTGATTFGNFGSTHNATGVVNVEVGLECASGSCTPYGDPGGDFDPDPRVDLPEPDATFKADFRIHLHAFAVAALGPRIRKLQLDVLEIRVGPAQSFDLSTMAEQAESAEYASSFRTTLRDLAKPGSHVEEFVKLFKTTIVKLEFPVEFPLAESLKGTFTIEPASVRAGNDQEPGELVIFTVTLDPTTYFGFDAVRHLEFYRKGEGGELERFSRPDGACQANADKSVFTCTLFMLEEHMGEQTFYAFVRANLGPVPFPVPLEIAKDSKATLTVTEGGVQVQISAEGNLNPVLKSGETVQFTATVTGAEDTDVTWRIEPGFPTGTIDSNGLYRAPSVAPGESARNTVIATSMADPSAEDTATVFVSEPNCFPTDEKPCGGSGSSFGDPHLMTPDGFAYDFMAVGDFVLVKSTDATEGFEIQSRFRPPDGAEEFSWNEAVAMRVGSDVVNVYAVGNGLPELMINGEDIAIEDGFSRRLTAGGAVQVSGDTVTVSWTDGTMLRVAPATWAPQKVLAFVETFIPAHRSGAVEGLLGDFDGDPNNDLRIRGGEVLTDPTEEELYLDFRQSWRVVSGSAESLFFRDFENWDPLFPPDAVGLDDLDPAAVASAETVCRAAGVVDPRIFEACAFDVALTGDDEWALVAAGIDPSIPSVTVAPGLAYLADGASRQFSAIVTGPGGGQVIWTATGGSITQDSETQMTYTALAEAGAYTITATLASDGSVSDQATVHVTALDAPDGYTAVWSGAVDTDWRNGANWVAGTPPGPTDNVFIPANAAHQPVLAGPDEPLPRAETTIRDLLVEAGASVTLNGATDRFNAFRLLASGNVNAAGRIISEVPGEGHLIMIGSGKTLQGNVSNLEIGGSISLAGATTVSDTLLQPREYYDQPRVLDLNGQTLTVAGNVNISSMDLRMEDPADRLIVRGDVTFRGTDLRGMLTAGEIHLAGNFEAWQADNSNVPASFPSTGTKVVLNGTAEQTVTFHTRGLNGVTASHFHDLEITNPTVVRFEPMYANPNGVPIRGDLRVSAPATLAGAAITVLGDLTTVSGSNITLGRVRLAGPLGTTGVGGDFSPNIVQFIGSDQPMKPDFAYRNVEITGYQTVTEAPTARLTGPTTVTGNLQIRSSGGGGQGELDLNGQTITVKGDFLNGPAGRGYRMTNAADRLIIEGNMTQSFGGSTEGKLTAGQVHLAGDFSAGPGADFAPSGTKMVLNGTVKQTVTMNATFTGRIASYFHDLEITNPVGVTLGDRTPVRNDLDLTGKAIIPSGATATVTGTLFLRSKLDFSHLR
jgi:hypothetical protein